MAIDAATKNENDHKIIYNDLFQRIKTVKLSRATSTEYGLAKAGSGLSSEDGLISHSAITTTPTTTGKVSLAYGSKYTFISAISTDNGHVTAYTASEYTMPSETKLSKGTDVTADNGLTYVTDVGVSNHKITLTKGSIQKGSTSAFGVLKGKSNSEITITDGVLDHKSHNNTKTDATATLSFGGKFKAVSAASFSNGHNDSYTLSEFTLPSETALTKGTTKTGGSGQFVTDVEIGTDSHSFVLTTGTLSKEANGTNGSGQFLTGIDVDGTKIKYTTGTLQKGTTKTGSGTKFVTDVAVSGTTITLSTVDYSPPETANDGKLTLTAKGSNAGSDLTAEFTANQSGESSFTIPLATTTGTGLVRVGSNLTIDDNGVLSATAQKLNVTYSDTPPGDGTGTEGDIVVVGGNYTVKGYYVTTNSTDPPTSSPVEGDIWFSIE